MQSVDFMDGFSISVGDYVRFNGEGTDGYGTVTGFKGDRVLLDVDEDKSVVYAFRYKLNAKSSAYSGKEDYWAPRDIGVSGGCIKRPNWNWAEPK